MSSELEQAELQAAQSVEEYHKDVFRSHMRDLMGLGATAPLEDDYLLNMLGDKMRHLQALEEEREQMTELLNCPKDQVLEKVIAAEVLNKKLEEAKGQAKKEKENYERAILDFRNDLTRVTQMAEAAVSQCRDLTEELTQIEEDRERTGFWSGLVDKLTGKSDTPEKVEILESEV